MSVQSSSSTEPPLAPDGSDAGVDRHRAVDDRVIRGVSLALIGATVAYALLASESASSTIDGFRTFVTANFTWYFVILATIALIFCIYMAVGQRGRIVLGGRSAKVEYSNFAWYSMLFACGQGIGLIFWSVAEPIMVQSDNPLTGMLGVTPDDGALIWTYFHWSIHAWAIYCVVALCLALWFHNMKSPMTFRDAVVGAFPAKSRRSLGIVIEVIAILATTFGLSTSFAFAAMQFTSGLSETFGSPNTAAIQTIVILSIGVVAAISVYIGVEKGMKRISEANSILSIILVIGVLIFGPTLYILSVIPQSFGQYLFNGLWMGTWSDAMLATEPLLNWTDSWNGWWTVFIWSWCFAFSPFVGSFIARISRGRTLREFVIGVLGIPSFICMIWIAVIGGAALQLDRESGGAVTEATMQDTSLGLFAALKELPLEGAGFVLLIIATILVGTYYITSLDSGVHALSSFTASATKPSKAFRTALVVAIALIAFLLLSIGGESVVGTVQTGTIIGALPYTVVVLILMVQTAKVANELRWDHEQVADDPVLTRIAKVRASEHEDVTDRDGDALEQILATTEDPE